MWVQKVPYIISKNYFIFKVIMEITKLFVSRVNGSNPNHSREEKNFRRVFSYLNESLINITRAHRRT